MWMHVAVQRAENKAVDGAFAILGLPRVDGLVTSQITLPHCHGSLSRTSPAQVLRPVFPRLTGHLCPLVL
jgi:hypothetical protein